MNAVPKKWTIRVASVTFRASGTTATKVFYLTKGETLWDALWRCSASEWCRATEIIAARIEMGPDDPETPGDGLRIKEMHRRLRNVEVEEC